MTVEAGLPAPPAAAEQIFGPGLDRAARYGELLASAGVVRGLIGPREVPRLWDRHLLNCAVVADLVPDGARVVDVGTGAGLPGLAMACRRPDLRIDLVESLARRVAFLTEAVESLGLGERVRVVHGRAEVAAVRSVVGDAEWVAARAVAPLVRLVKWCLPLLRVGGTLLAMKGAQAEAEVAALPRRLDVGVRIERCGRDVLDTPVTVVAVQRDRTRRGRD
ncbi:MAG TPA: 16S rRNA (guanine(527)-N(7))-methyltransferase RsmG [Jatrophihabitantaceae bacterium]